MKKLLFLLVLLPVAAWSQVSTITTRQTDRYLTQPTPSNPPANSGYVYYVSDNTLHCVNPDGSSCLSAGGSSNTNPGNPYILATSYGVKADTQQVWDATITNTSQTVTCPNSDCNFTQKDVGKIVFGTNVASGGYTSQITSVVILPQGTITSINNANSIQVSVAATASSGAGLGVLIWGDDDTTALGAAWTATVASCSTLRLPGINQQGTGPAMMLIQSASFNIAMAGSGTGSNATCSLGTGGNRRGVGLVGADVNSTYIIPTPNFNFSTCTFGASAHACMFTTFDGVNLSNFTFWGAGVSNPGSVSSDYVTEINSAAIAFTATAGNSSINNVTFMGWGTNASGTGFKACLRFDGGVTSTNYLTEDGCGQIGFEANNLLVLHNAQAFDNMVANLYVVAGATVLSSANYFCCTGQGGGGDALVGVFGTYFSNGDSYGAAGIGNTTISASNALNVGYLSAASTSLNASGGIAHVNNAVMSVSGNSGSGQGIFVCGTQGGTCPGANTLYLSNSSVTIGNSRAPLTLYGNYYDLGGNTLVGTPSVAASGVVFGAASITGTAVAANKLALSANWGTSAAVSALSGFNSPIKFTITNGSASVGAAPTVTYTFPTPYLQAPLWCTATQVGGTNATGTFAAGTPSSTSVVFTYSLTPTINDTELVQVQCAVQQ